MYFYGHAQNWSISVTRKAGWSGQQFFSSSLVKTTSQIRQIHSGYCTVPAGYTLIFFRGGGTRTTDMAEGGNAEQHKHKGIEETRISFLSKEHRYMNSHHIIFMTVNNNSTLKLGSRFETTWNNGNKNSSIIYIGCIREEPLFTGTNLKLAHDYAWNTEDIMV